MNVRHENDSQQVMKMFTNFQNAVTNRLVFGAWDLKSFIENLRNYVSDVGASFIALLGLLLIIMSGVKIWRNLFSENQQRQPRWAMTITGLLVGGAMLVGGLTLLTDIASGGNKTITDLGGGVITLLLSNF